MQVKNQINQANRLILLGLILFLIGLAIGFVVHNTANPRMALSAHMEGIMNGMFLMIPGLIWQRLMLSNLLLKLTFWLALYGTFANLTAVIFAAITGSGKMMPIAGGQEGTVMAEGLITFLLISLSLCMVAVCLIVIIGFYKHMRQPNQHTFSGPSAK
jgi:hydroxylaminobenzene mutase